MVTPDAVIGDSNPLITFSVGADENAVDVEDAMPVLALWSERVARFCSARAACLFGIC